MRFHFLIYIRSAFPKGILRERHGWHQEAFYHLLLILLSKRWAKVNVTFFICEHKNNKHNAFMACFSFFYRGNIWRWSFILFHDFIEGEDFFGLNFITTRSACQFIHFFSPSFQSFHVYLWIRKWLLIFISLFRCLLSPCCVHRKSQSL